LRRPGTVEGGEPASATAATESGRDITSSVVETALEVIGTPYVWGGTGANGFDCSGLIRYAYGQHGVDLPRISADQLRRGRAVGTRIEALEPGDVLGFSAVLGGEVTHVGLYVGDGRFIHSSSSGVRITTLWEPYWMQHFMAARRIVY
jgi:cell wall-associated NlpC family hydrolase